MALEAKLLIDISQNLQYCTVTDMHDYTDFQFGLLMICGKINRANAFMIKQTLNLIGYNSWANKLFQTEQIFPFHF